MADTPCPFCTDDGALLGNPLAYVRADKFPVTAGHLLLIPRRHEPDFLAVTADELAALWELLGHAKGLLERERHPDGYNLGVNVGVAAGQTVSHAHLHLIPRYRGDSTDPRGGVRAVIPARQHDGGA